MSNAFQAGASVPGVWPAIIKSENSGKSHPVVNVLDPTGRVLKIYPVVGKIIMQNKKAFLKLLHDQQMLTDPEYVREYNVQQKVLHGELPKRAGGLDPLGNTGERPSERAARLGNQKMEARQLDIGGKGTKKPSASRSGRSK